MGLLFLNFSRQFGVVQTVERNLKIKGSNPLHSLALCVNDPEIRAYLADSSYEVLLVLQYFPRGIRYIYTQHDLMKPRLSTVYVKLRLIKNDYSSKSLDNSSMLNYI